MASKKGGTAATEQDKKQEQEKEQSRPIRVKIDKLLDSPDGKLKAIASANIGDFAVHGIRVYESEKGLFASMPSTSYTDAQGEKHYEDIFHPVTKEAREQLCGAILGEYKNALTEAETAQVAETQTQSQTVQKM